VALFPDIAIIQGTYMYRVTHLRVLGVVINSKLTMVGQIANLSATYASSIKRSKNTEDT